MKRVIFGNFEIENGQFSAILAKFKGKKGHFLQFWVILGEFGLILGDFGLILGEFELILGEFGLILGDLR